MCRSASSRSTAGGNARQLTMLPGALAGIQPSTLYSVIAVPPNFPDAAYVADQGRASKSGYHLAHFFNEVSKLFTGFDPTTIAPKIVSPMRRGRRVVGA